MDFRNNHLTYGTGGTFGAKLIEGEGLHNINPLNI
jgi:hypothetical protein